MEPTSLLAHYSAIAADHNYTLLEGQPLSQLPDTSWYILSLPAPPIPFVLGQHILLLSLPSCIFFGHLRSIIMLEWSYLGVVVVVVVVVVGIIVIIVMIVVMVVVMGVVVGGHGDHRGGRGRGHGGGHDHCGGGRDCQHGGGGSCGDGQRWGWSMVGVVDVSSLPLSPCWCHVYSHCCQQQWWWLMHCGRHGCGRHGGGCGRCVGVTFVVINSGGG